MHTKYPFSWSENCRVIPGVQCTSKTKQILKKAKDEHIKCLFCSQPHLLIPLLISFLKIRYFKNGSRKVYNLEYIE